MADESQRWSVFELRPLNLADILDVIVKIYRGHFAQLMGICAAVLVPLGVLQMVMVLPMFSGVLTGEPDDIDMNALPVMMIAGVLYALLMAVALPVMQAAMAKAISSYYLGASTTFGEVYKFALRKWATLLGVTLLMGLVVGAVAAVCVIPIGVMAGVAGSGMVDNTALTVAAVVMGLGLGLAALVAVSYVGTMLYFCTLVVVLEDTRAVPALRRSWSLVSGHFWRVFGTVLVLSMMVSIARSIMVYPVQLGMMLLGEDLLLVATAVTQGIAVVAQLVTFPLSIAGSVLLYYDLRIRKEGFDLAAMAEAIGQPELATRTSTGEAAPALFGDTRIPQTPSRPLTPPPPPPPLTPPPPPPPARTEETSDGPPDFPGTP